MTLKELSQLYYLTREIEANEKRLEELTDLIGPATAKYSDMPKGPFNTESPTERLAAEITDLKAILAARQIQLIHERARLDRDDPGQPDPAGVPISLCVRLVMATGCGLHRRREHGRRGKNDLLSLSESRQAKAEYSRVEQPTAGCYFCYAEVCYSVCAVLHRSGVGEYASAPTVHQGQSERGL